MNGEKVTGAVLVIDDESIVREAMADALSIDGIKVFEARNGDEGVEQLQRHLDEIAVVILDLSMPGLPSHETFTALRKIRPDLPILLCSGYTEREVTPGEYENYTGYIHKPFDLIVLLDAIGQFVDVPDS